MLELVQNADDNIYEEGVLPALEFVVDNQEIVINNNERGFRKEDVKVWKDFLFSDNILGFLISFADARSSASFSKPRRSVLKSSHLACFKFGLKTDVFRSIGSLTITSHC